jgi:hypothetical protein
LGRVVGKDYGETADFNIFAADSVEEGGIGRGAKRARDICSKGGVFEVKDGRYSS